MLKPLVHLLLSAVLGDTLLDPEAQCGAHVKPHHNPKHPPPNIPPFLDTCDVTWDCVFEKSVLDDTEIY